MNNSDKMKAALKGHTNAAEILAMLEQDNFDQSIRGANDVVARETAMPQLEQQLVYQGVLHTARWTATEATLWDADDKPAYLGNTTQAGVVWDAYKAAQARDAHNKAVDREAFPYLFDSSGRRVKLDGRTWKANMAKVRDRIRQQATAANLQA